MTQETKQQTMTQSREAMERAAREYIKKFAHHEAWQVSTINMSAIAEMMAEFTASQHRAAMQRCAELISLVMKESCEGCKVDDAIVMHHDSEWHDDGCGQPWAPCQAWPLRDLNDKLKAEFPECFQ